MCSAVRLHLSESPAALLQQHLWHYKMPELHEVPCAAALMLLYNHSPSLQVLEGLVGVNAILKYLQGVSGHSTGAKSTQQLAVSSIIGPDPMSNLKLVNSRYQLWQRFPANSVQEAVHFYQSKCASHPSESTESVDSQT